MLIKSIKKLTATIITFRLIITKLRLVITLYKLPLMKYQYTIDELTKKLLLLNMDY